MVDWISLAVPFAYLGVLIGSLATFSHLYRARKAAKAASLAPWFGPHLGRNIYLSLLHMEPAEGKPKVPDSVLKAALMRRAVEDIHRLVEVRNAKQALQSLLQKGSVGDDLWQRFQRAEKEIEAELRDVVQEANAFSPGWGQTIFQSASEIAQNQLLQQRVAELQAQASTEKEWWDKKRATIQADFMKELDAGSQTKNSDDDAVLVEAGGPATTGAPQQQQQQQRPKSRGKKKK
ncbi:Pre protein translocase subunit Sec66-domain-containing protein [Phyllosticta capitalensis]